MGKAEEEGGKKKTGRPRKWKPEMPELAKMACGLGCTDKQLAERLGISERTLHYYKKEYPEFCEALQEGKEIADDAVEVSLFKRAMGYSHPEVHVSNYQGKVTITPIIKHYPPDTAAAFIWLKNRRPDKWRDRQEFKHEGFEHFLEFLSGRSDGKNRTDDDVKSQGGA